MQIPTSPTGAGAAGVTTNPAAKASGDKSSLVFSSTAVVFLIPCFTLKEDYSVRIKRINVFLITFKNNYMIQRY